MAEPNSGEPHAASPDGSGSNIALPLNRFREIGLGAKNIGNQLNRSASVCRPVFEPVAAARRLCRCAVIDYCPEDPQTRSGRIYDRNSQRGRADDGKWTLARAMTSHHPYRWIPSRPLSDVFRCPLDASEDCGGAPDDSGTLNFQCPPLALPGAK